MSQLPVGAKPVCPIARLWEDILAAPRIDTGTTQRLEEPSKADMALTAQADKMRDLRLHMVATLEGYVNSSEISCHDAVLYFSNATLLDEVLTIVYFSTFCVRDSRLQLYASARLGADRV